MPLQTQVIDVPFTGGLREDVDPLVLPPGSVVTAENCVYEKQGGIQRRVGYSLLTANIEPTGTIASPISMGTFGGELLCVAKDTTGSALNGSRILSYAPGQNKWEDKAEVPNCLITRKTYAAPSTGAFNGQIVVTSSYTMYLYATLTSGGAYAVYYRVVDNTTGTVLVDDTLLPVTPTASTVEAVACGNTPIVVVYNATGLISAKYTFATNTWTTATTVAAASLGAGAAQHAQIAAIDSSSYVISYDANTNHVTLAKCSVSTLAVTASVSEVIFTPGPGGDYTAVSCDGSNICMLWFDVLAGANYVRVRKYNTSLTPAWATCNLSNNMTTFTTGPNSLDVCEDVNGIIAVLGFDDCTRVFRCSTAGVGTNYWGTDGRQLWHTFPTSKLFVHEDRIYGLVNTYSGFATYDSGASTVVSDGTKGQQSFTGALVCYDWDTSATVNGTWAAKLCAVTGVGQGLPSFLNIPRSRVVNANGETTKYLTAHGQIGNLPLTDRDGFVTSSTGLAVCELQFQDKTNSAAKDWSHMFAQCGTNALAGCGGYTYFYDGVSVCEAGFIHTPVVTTDASASRTAYLTAGETHGTAFIYRWSDARGNWHESAPAIGNRTVGVGHNSISHTVRNIGLTSRQGAADGANRIVTIQPYMTDGNSSGPYKTSELMFNNGFPKENSLTSETTPSIIFYIEGDDANQVSVSLPYDIPGNPGVLAPELPPGSRAICSWKNRLWIASADDVRELWYTRTYTYGEAPAFSSLLRVRVDDAPDEITGIAPLGDKLAIFTKTRIYYLTGDGYNDNGTGSNFAGPYLISPDVGCFNPMSVVSTAVGVFFESGNGIKLLNQSLQIEDIGAAVQDKTDYYNLPLSSCADPKKQRVYFLRYSDADGENAYLVYDYKQRVWTRFMISDSTGGLCCTVWNGNNIYAGNLDSDYNFIVEDSAAQNDDTGVFEGVVETPWIKVGALAGYQRVRRVVVTGHISGTVNLKVSLFTDYNSIVTADQTRNFATGTTDGEPIRLEMHVTNQKCAAIKVRIEDITGAGGSTWTLNGVSLEVGVKRGVAKPMGTNSFVDKGYLR